GGILYEREFSANATRGRTGSMRRRRRVRGSAHARQCAGVCATAPDGGADANSRAGECEDSGGPIGFSGGADRAVSRSVAEPDAGGFDLSAGDHATPAVADEK